MLSLIGITIFVVLGCHIQHIQQDRLSTAITFAQSITAYHQNGTQIEPIWFLTGGVKNALVEHVGTEADKMASMLSEVSIKNVVLDTNAQNTAENFVNLKHWINKFGKFDVNVVITTSSFHQKRAQKIFEGVFHDINIKPKWNLGSASCQHCETDEHIHIRNVENDVKKALFSSTKNKRSS